MVGQVGTFAKLKLVDLLTLKGSLLTCMDNGLQFSDYPEFCSHDSSMENMKFNVGSDGQIIIVFPTKLLLHYETIYIYSSPLRGGGL